MFRLTRAAAIAAVLVTAASGLAALPAAAADPIAACGATTAPGLQWTAPSFLAWGREARIGANVTDPGTGPGYDDGSVALSLDAGKASATSDPIDHDLEFALQAPAHGAAANVAATWTMVDETQTVSCAQTAALSVPLGFGKTLRYQPKGQGTGGIAWIPVDAGDCHDIALRPISLTVSQGGVKRSLSAPDQCNPVGDKRVATADWELSLAKGQFHLRALRAHSSLKTRMRFALRVGSRRVASGSVSLVRTFRPERLIVVANPDFQGVCVGRLQIKQYGLDVGCKVPSAFSLRLSLVQN
jgi:hypothetical protein